MSLAPDVRARIDAAVATHQIVLFMKGTRAQPQCGFSAAVIGILDSIVPDYATVDVLADPEIREGIKLYSDWPTIPQLYIGSEFVGGCDVVQQMYTAGDLHRALGLEPVTPEVPAITISDAAAAAIRDVNAEHPGMAVHLAIDAGFDHQFSLAPRKGHEIVASSNGIDILFDLASAGRAGGLVIDMAETPQGTGFSIANPNAPPPVAQMSVEELKQRLDGGEPLNLFDVREAAEREIARIDGSRLLDEAAVKEIDALPRDAVLVFQCHSGGRSQAAAEYFRAQGFTEVYNLAGGIDAWSARIDANVPRY